VVADRAMKVHESVFPEVSGPDRQNWVGTVHVMQGKEADVVVLVLGGNPDRPGGAPCSPRLTSLSTMTVANAAWTLFAVKRRSR
jgi:hypothetical protein